MADILFRLRCVDSGAHVINVILLAIQVRWKLCLAVIQLLPVRSQQIFAHAMTAQLSWHVQNFVVITLSESMLKQNQISIKFEWQCDYHQWNGHLNKHSISKQTILSTHFIQAVTCHIVIRPTLTSDVFYCLGIEYDDPMKYKHFPNQYWPFVWCIPMENEKIIIYNQ